MTDLNGELVLVIPRPFLFQGGDRSFQGFLSAPAALLFQRMAAGSFFMPRSAVEEDRYYKQLIIYLVLRHQSSVFVYYRKKGSAEKRLVNNYSLGLGGHINPTPAYSFQELLHLNLRRELQEEIRLRGSFSYHLWGIINDDTTEVGKCHLGLVYLVSSAEPHLTVRERDKLQGKFLPVAELAHRDYHWESWSSILLPDIRATTLKFNQ